jgi:uncharacterized membrane protein
VCLLNVVQRGTCSLRRPCGTDKHKTLGKMWSLRVISLVVHILTSRLPATTTQYRNTTSLAVYTAPLTQQSLALPSSR